MTRPQARRSTLSGASPIQPPATPAESKETSVTLAEQQTRTYEPAAPAAVTSVYDPEPAKAPKKTKMAFYQPVDRQAQVRAAYMRVGHIVGARSLSDFIDRAVMEYVEELGRLHNGGQPWEPVEPGRIPTGHPVQG